MMLKGKGGGGIWQPYMISAPKINQGTYSTTRACLTYSKQLQPCDIFWPELGCQTQEEPLDDLCCCEAMIFSLYHIQNAGD